MRTIAATISTLWQCFKTEPAQCAVMEWLANQPSVHIEQFPAFNGRTVYTVAVGNIMASGHTLGEAAEACRTELARSRSIKPVFTAIP